MMIMTVMFSTTLISCPRLTQITMDAQTHPCISLLELISLTTRKLGFHILYHFNLDVIVEVMISIIFLLDFICFLRQFLFSLVTDLPFAISSALIFLVFI